MRQPRIRLRQACHELDAAVAGQRQHKALGTQGRQCKHRRVSPVKIPRYTFVANQNADVMRFLRDSFHNRSEPFRGWIGHRRKLQSVRAPGKRRKCEWFATILSFLLASLHYPLDYKRGKGSAPTYVGSSTLFSFRVLQTQAQERFGVAMRLTFLVFFFRFGVLSGFPATCSCLSCSCRDLPVNPEDSVVHVVPGIALRTEKVFDA